MSEQFHALSFEQLADGTVRLKQPDFSDDCIIDAHPEQIRYIARRLCGLKHETASQVADLERRISVLADGLHKLVTADWFRKDIVKRCGDGIEIMCRLDALLDLALEFDGGRLLPDSPVTTEPSRPRPLTMPGMKSISSMEAPPAGGEQLGLPV